MNLKCRPRLPCAVLHAYQGRHFSLYEITIKAESVVPYEPVLTAQANLGRHFTHMH